MAHRFCGPSEPVAYKSTTAAESDLIAGTLDCALMALESMQSVARCLRVGTVTRAMTPANPIQYPVATARFL